MMAFGAGEPPPAGTVTLETRVLNAQQTANWVVGSVSERWFSVCKEIHTNILHMHSHTKFYDA